MGSMKPPNSALLRCSSPLITFSLHHRCSTSKFGFVCNINGGGVLARTPPSPRRVRGGNENVLHAVRRGSVREDDGDKKFQILTAMRTNYNDIIIVDTPQSRMLLLDSTHNVHSILNKHQKWTDSYWDDFASLPPIIPKGPIAIFGLGAGTAARLMLDLWPSIQLEGWEIDDILIDKAREYFGLSDLEKHNQSGGILNIQIGDALSHSGNNCSIYAGIIVDLFCDGKVLSQLQEVETWLELKDKLIPNGRLMVNCGGLGMESDILNGGIRSNLMKSPWVENSTIKALSKAFPGQLNWKRTAEGQGANYLALTGPLPDMDTWSAMVPDRLGESVKQWRTCCSSS